MVFNVYPFHTLKDYFCVDIMAVYQGKWIFCKHKKRDTWENPGGHIEAGETPLDAAKRELYEETGALHFQMEPLCDYDIDGEVDGAYFKGNVQVYFAAVHTLGALPPESEMERIQLFESFPEEIKFPMSRDFFPMALEKKRQMEREQPAWM